MTDFAPHHYITSPLALRGAACRPRGEAPRLAIVVPCLNEEEALPATHSRLLSELRRLKGAGMAAPGSYILYVDDGSVDGTWKCIETIADGNPSEAGGISLSSNAGHQQALMAGMKHAMADSDAIVTIDADLQDDPGAIGAMLGEYMRGYDIVYGVRSDRSSDSAAKRGAAQLYYRLLKSLGARTVYNHGDYRLMSRRAAAALDDYGERNLYLRGIVPMLGFSQSRVYFSRGQRVAGHTKYPLGRMINFAIDGITSFSVRPVRMVIMAGLLFLLVALGMLVFVLVRYFTRQTIEGWSSLMLSIWFCSGVLLMAIGVIGEYVGKIYTEVKHRPRYHLDRTAGRASASPSEILPTPTAKPESRYS